jgi:hypothetical protein
VVASNYRPYEGVISVSAGGANINRLDPEDGTETQLIHVGGRDFSGSENVEIYFDDTRLLTTAASGGSFGQAGGTDVDISVPSPHDLGPVNVAAVGLNSSRHAVDVFAVRTANPIDLYTYGQWAEDTWHLHTGNNPTWNNPEIQIYDAATNAAVESNNLSAGHNYIVKVKVHNDTNFDARSVIVTLKWANFGVGQPERVWERIDTDEIDVPRNSIREAEIAWAPGSTGHICLLAEIYHLEDINEDNNHGQENCHVGPTSSPAKVAFLVWNPTDKPAAIYLELRQKVDEDDESAQPIWGSMIIHPEPQVIPPGEFGKASVIIDPDMVDIKRGTVEFMLTGFINRRMIGGANFIIQHGNK